VKNHKRKQVYIYGLEGSIPDVFAHITEAAGDMLEPTLVKDGWDDPEWYVEGWVPMTEAEIIKAKRDAALLRERKKAAIQAQTERELETVRSLAKKHGLVVQG
jgi:superfamily II DNA or RNA helicase